MPARLFLISVLALFAASADAYGGFPPYTLEVPALSLWLAMGVLAFMIAARRRRFDTDERS